MRPGTGLRKRSGAELSLSFSALSLSLHSKLRAQTLTDHDEGRAIVREVFCLRRPGSRQALPLGKELGAAAACKSDTSGASVLLHSTV